MHEGIHNHFTFALNGKCTTGESSLVVGESSLAWVEGTMACSNSISYNIRCRFSRLGVFTERGGFSVFTKHSGEVHESTEKKSEGHLELHF